MKRLTSIALALVMALALAVPAFAVEVESGVYAVPDEFSIAVVSGDGDGCIMVGDALVLLRSVGNYEEGWTHSICVVDKKGNVRGETAIQGEVGFGDYSDDWASFWVWNGEERQNAFVNRTGEVIVFGGYDQIGLPSDGLVPVAKGDWDSGHQWGYADTNTTLVLPMEYDSAGQFVGGLAVVKKDGKMFAIDKTGATVFDLTPFGASYTWRLSNGLIVVSNKTYQHGVVDTTGKLVTPMEYVNIWNFSEDMAIVIVKDGDYKYGYMDATGAVVIPPQYDNASDFNSDGVARVGARDENGVMQHFYINKTGAKVEYDGSRDYCYGGLAFDYGTNAFIDRDGNEYTFKDWTTGSDEDLYYNAEGNFVVARYYDYTDGHKAVVLDLDALAGKAPTQPEQPVESETPTTPSEPATPSEPEQPGTPDAPIVPDAPGSYTVQAGDTWSTICTNFYGNNAQRYNLMKANNSVNLKPGTVITLPEKLGNATLISAPVAGEGETLYTVQAGDTLGKIAVAQYGNFNAYKDIFERNSDRLKNANTIYEGQVIVLPAK